MFSATAEFYDAIYSSKDYASEAQKIRQLIHVNCPGAKTILDVACGTGEHAKHLSKHFSVDGIDINPAFVEIARAKNPKGQFQVADMRSFRLDKRYDVVQCLFSSIGYLSTRDDVVHALECFRNHLAPGGIILIEPWFPPTVYKTGKLYMDTVDRPDLKICRMSLAQRDGDIAVLIFHYLIATKDGIHRAEETHRLALISPEQMASNFQAAGLRCEFDPVGLTGRGMFVAWPSA
jgi:SAM-dependent methyltransferase